MKEVELICRAIPELEEEIRLRYSSDPEFRQVCQDYLKANRAGRYWATRESEKAAGYTEEYLNLVKALKIEILSLLTDKKDKST